MNNTKFWSPYIAGISIGLVLVAMFYVAGRGLGASGAFSLLGGVGTHLAAPGYASSLSYFSRYLENPSPLMDWNLFMVVGVFLGAIGGALLFKNFKVKLDKAAAMTARTRLFTAFSGGVLLGFAARLARGCTSGVGLTGGAQLALSGWIFVSAMFISGFIFAAIFRRLWS